ncbi:1-deoxy-D-xylulose-5-phosphate reductoisomerase [bacterium]|jgi:1-deoxy-D-xylulose-5-phosphate reductoisomerase|nr:1-deoxy-D-xylulose-5-phosphate reductoisomerase [bacterium]MBT6832203.1 1-deoxy-D-xylulose-5-phosphate reductoisomerase [bacterium]MBT6996148.1 1-deoxy-D-xylulose-5-phosphate reductoisomerase [bacterium]MBT7772228.1 1-deoxy-D-xylulose-5-phosphate reductoisomerase [bacterium]
MRKIVLLGATGSIGRTTLDLVRRNPEKFQIVGASAHSNFGELEKIASKFQIPNLLDTRGEFSATEFLKKCEPDIVLNAVSGFSGLKFSIAAGELGVDLALANKESLVAGGELLTEIFRKNGGKILPVDSEHSAIFQCLAGRSDFEKIFLTCSGGPFFGKNSAELSQISVEQALAHPRWKMGAKISVDSATLANKVLEVFEAMHLFSLRRDQIEILIHPQSIVHSMVQFRDSSVIAQISPPTMELPISLALNFPEKIDTDCPCQNFKNLNLSFFEPDLETFRTLKILEICAEKMQNFPIVFNAANEIFVAEFLAGNLKFLQIFELLERAISETKFESVDSIKKIFEIDERARKMAITFLKK